MKTITNFPTLELLLGQGIVTIKDGEYVGVASDGVEVQFGVVGFEEETESYLADNPSPSDW